MKDSSTADAGEIAERTRGFDWSTTPLGPIEHWPPTLKSAVARALGAADTPQPAAAELHQSEERFRALAALAPAGIYLTDAAGNCRYANARWCEMAGLTEAEARGDGWINGLHAQDRQRVASSWQQMMHAPGRWSQEYRFQDRAGQVTWVYGLAAPLLDAAGRLDGYIGVNTDITERKLAQQALEHANAALARHIEERSAALRSSEQRYRDLVEQAVDGIFVADLSGHLLDANSSGAKMFGCALEELRALRFSDLIVPAEVARVAGAFAQLGSGGVVTSQWQFLRRDGSTFPGEIVAQRFPGGRLLGILRDITARKQVEDALRRSEERFRKVFEAVATGIAITDLQGRFEQSNPAYRSLIGYSEEELHQTGFARLVHPDDREANVAAFHRLLAGEIGHFEIENRLVRKDGSLRWVRKFVSALPDETGQPARLVALVTDVTERKRAVQALHELNATLEQRIGERTAALQASEERQRAILDTVVDAIVTIDEQGTIVSANPATESICGYPPAELVGQNVKILMPSPYREQHDRHLEEYRRTGRSPIIGTRREVQAQRKDGTPFPIELAIGQAQCLGLITCVMRDLTERKRLEADVLEIGEGERLRLAAELHDGVCQELAGIGYKLGGVLQGQEPITPAVAKELTTIAGAIFQVAQHTRQVAHAMNPLITAGEGLMLGLRQLAATTSRSHGVQCLFSCPQPVLVPQPTLAFQLYRVAQEAIHNAIQHGDAKRVTIRLSEREGAVCLEIIDSGTGLPAAAVNAPGMGIRTMKYRVGLIGGQFSIERRRRGGTAVRCLVPPPANATREPGHAIADAS